MLFSFLLPGAGNLYVNDITTGVIVVSISVVNFFLAFTLIWLIIGIPLWLGLFIWTAIDSSNKASRHNERYGLV